MVVISRKEIWFGDFFFILLHFAATTERTNYIEKSYIGAAIYLIVKKHMVNNYFKISLKWDIAGFPCIPLLEQ